MGDERPGPVASPDALFARYRATGDPAALAALFDATVDGLYRVALAVVADPVTAEDAVQETFLAVIEAAPRFDPARPVLPWLIGILRNKAAYLRRSGARSPDPARLSKGNDERGPAAAAAVRDDEERVRTAIEALPESLRGPARMRWRDGLEPVEIARAVGARPGAVRMALARALKRLRVSLGGMPAWVLAGSREPRGLEAVRNEVVRRAAAATLGKTAAAAAGGVLVAKKAVVVVAVVALLLLAGRLAWRSGEGPGVSPPPAPALRAVNAVLPPVTSADAPEVEAAPPVSAAPPPEASPAKETPVQRGMTGRVVNLDRGPAKGAKVSFHVEGGVAIDVTTDAEGKFTSPRLRLAGPGKYSIHVVAKDDAGNVAWTTQTGGAYGPEGYPIDLPPMDLPTLVLRPPATLTVLVTTGGVPVPGAAVEVRGETRLGGIASAEANGEGRATFEGLPSGAWMVRARAAGLGRGTAHVTLPLAEADSVEVAVTSRNLLVEVVERDTGAPVEGAEIAVWEWWQLEGQPWNRPGEPPVEVQPTDSAGRTTVEGLFQDEKVKILATGDGGDRLLGSADVGAGVLSVRIVVPPAPTVRFAVSGEGLPPPEGTVITADYPGGASARFKGRMEGTDLVMAGLPQAEVRLIARAPDGRLAVLRAAAGASRGEPTVFHPPRKLEVRVVDPDGRPVTDSLVFVHDAKGKILQGTHVAEPDGEGRTVVTGLPADVVVAWVLAHSAIGGAPAARVDLREGDGRVEIRVGYEVEIVLRMTMGGEARLPPDFTLEILYRPTPELGGYERVTDAREDAKSGEVRFRARAFPPEAPILIVLEIPGWRRWSVEAPPQGGNVTLDIPASKER